MKRTVGVGAVRTVGGGGGPLGRDAGIYVAGDDTLLGRALVRRLADHGYRTILNHGRPSLDLRDRAAVDAFFAGASPAYVFVAAGRSGGIRANQLHPADLMLDNLTVACHLIGCAHAHGVRKLLYQASSCVYPKYADPPMRTPSLLAGPLEGTSEAYALAKLSGIKLCQAYRRQYDADFVVGITADVFGPGDDFSPDNSHVLAALMRKMHEAKTRGLNTVELWGTGTPRREFVFVDDLADACIFVMERYSDADPINLGGGPDLSIRELAEAVGAVVGYSGRLRFDPAKPDGMPFKALDSSVLREMGWRPAVPFREALARTYEWFVESLRGAVHPTS